MIKSKKQIFIIIGLFTLLLFIGGTSYAWFTYRSETGSHEIVAGDIYLTMTQGNETLSLTNVFPETAAEARARNDNYITFSLDGLNESNKTIYYEILLNYGTSQASPKSRYTDSDLVFDLVELDSNDNEVEYVVNAKSYDSIINQRIWVDTINSGTTTNVSRKYKLRAWLSEDVIISDTEANANYTTTEYPNKYASIKVSVNGDFQEKEISQTAYNQITKNADTSTIINFGNKSDDNNGKGLYRLVGTENDSFPIYYYRGDINNNNVIFGDYCWQIVRTTDTGGIKMVYNGTVTGNGTTCTNSTHDTRTLPGYVKFNDDVDDVITTYPDYSGDVVLGMLYDSGYMYNQGYADYFSFDTSPVFGKNVEWDGTNYLVIDDTSGVALSNTTLDEYHHYSCGDNGVTSCSKVKYYFYEDYYDRVYVYLSNGETIEDALYKMIGYGTNATKTRNSSYNLNTNNSPVKDKIDTWFRTNLTNEVDNTKRNYVSYLEDTVYCNDRSLSSAEDYTSNGFNPNGGALYVDAFFFNIGKKIGLHWYSTSNVPTLSCENETDQFKVSNVKAHLTYPVGMLTAEEVILAGSPGSHVGATNSNNTAYYLYTGDKYWTMTPSHSYFYTDVYIVDNNGKLGDEIVNYGYEENNEYFGYKVRPVISLKLGTEFEMGGDGTPNNPYVVKYN